MTHTPVLERKIHSAAAGDGWREEEEDEVLCGARAGSMPKIGHDATRSVKNGAPRAPIARSEKTAQGCHWAGNLPWWFSSDAACREQRACVLGGGERVLSRDSDARCCCCRVGHRRAPAPDPAQREHPQRRQTTTTSTVQSIQLASNKNNNRFGLCRHLVFARRAR